MVCGCLGGVGGGVGWVGGLGVGGGWREKLCCGCVQHFFLKKIFLKTNKKILQVCVFHFSNIFFQIRFFVLEMAEKINAIKTEETNEGNNHF